MLFVPQEAGDVRKFLAQLFAPTPRERGTAQALARMLDETGAGGWGAHSTPATPIPRAPSARGEGPLSPLAGRVATAPATPAPRREAVGSFWQLRDVSAATSQPVSRYLSDFEEVEFLGRGAFGVVVKARNKLDGRFYAVKKVRLSSSALEEERTMREIMTLSRLDHPHIVRYVTCWIEETHAPLPGDDTMEASSELAMTTSQQMDASALRALHRIAPGLQGADASALGVDDFLSTEGADALSELAAYVEFEEGDGGGADGSSGSMSSGASSARRAGAERGRGASSHARTSRTLYIQMEYVENQTLGEAIERGLAVDAVWHIFRQMLEALAHIASLGIIHRDLKPSNVLMYANGDIKIGDFGLATTNVHAIEGGLRESVLSADDAKELTSGLGTFSYIAPEVLAKAGLGTRYNHKVDMFSLGIIFFEMLASQRYYTTVMERHQLLRDLRLPSVQFPRAWDAARFPAQTEIIRQLLDHDPARRPSPMAMLRSPLLPPKMQDEYVEELVRLVANPASVHRHQLISSLFARAHADDLRDYTFDTGAQSDEDDVLVGVVCQYLRSVFRKRGAVPVHAPLLLLPQEEYAGEAGLVRLLDKTGGVVLLPFDLTVPFARICARSGHPRLKRFDIADVYRENLLAGGQPRAILAASYDIVSPEPDPAAEAEVLTVAAELLEIPGLSGEPWELELSHGVVLAAVLDRFPVHLHASILSALPLLLTRGSDARIRQQLVQQGVSPAQLEELDALNVRADVDSVSRLLAHPPPSRVDAALQHLRAVIRLTHAFGVSRPVSIVPLLSHSHSRYRDGTMLAVVKYSNGGRHRDVLAVGGRYDALLRRFTYPSTAPKLPPSHAVGVQVSVGKIVAALARYQQVHVPKFMGRPEEERTLGPWTPRRCTVYIAASGAGQLEARIQLCVLLWTHGISADIQYEASAGESPEATAATCREEGISFLVLVRTHSRVLKVKEVISRTEHEVSKDELVPFLQERITRQRRIDQQTSNGSAMPADLPAIPAAAPLGSKGTAAAAFRTQESAPDVHVLLPRRSERSRRDRADRRMKPAARNMVVERAATETTRLVEMLASRQFPVFAVDVAPPLLARFATIATAPEDAFRAFLSDVSVAADEREYLRTIRAGILDAIDADDAATPTAAAGTSASMPLPPAARDQVRDASAAPAGASASRVLLYSVKDGRLLLSG
ncbi:non-specific serine/threonine protein kinase [Malassezia sp. CBS 17886]|nr:non-specific serine/threonine protein kinase [Malassezia sp. CBS 17886]